LGPAERDTRRRRLGQRLLAELRDGQRGGREGSGGGGSGRRDEDEEVPRHTSDRGELRPRDGDGLEQARIVPKHERATERRSQFRGGLAPGDIPELVDVPSTAEECQSRYYLGGQEHESLGPED